MIPAARTRLFARRTAALISDRPGSGGLARRMVRIGLAAATLGVGLVAVVAGAVWVSKVIAGPGGLTSPGVGDGGPATKTPIGAADLALDGKVGT